MKNLVTVRYCSVIKRGKFRRLSMLALSIISRFVMGFEGGFVRGHGEPHPAWRTSPGQSPD
jgi:hypothetical protein